MASGLGLPLRFVLNPLCTWFCSVIGTIWNKVVIEALICINLTHLRFSDTFLGQICLFWLNCLRLEGFGKAAGLDRLDKLANGAKADRSDKPDRVGRPDRLQSWSISLNKIESAHDAQTDSHPVQSLAPLLRQPAFAILPAGLLAPAGHFTGCEQPAHNRDSD